MSGLITFTDQLLNIRSFSTKQKILINFKTLVCHKFLNYETRPLNHNNKKSCGFVKYDSNRLSNYKLAGAYICINMPFAVLNETLTDKDDKLRRFYIRISDLVFILLCSTLRH